MELQARSFFKCDEFNVCIHSNLVRAPLLVTQLKAPDGVWAFAAGSTHRLAIRLTLPNLGKGLYSFSLICRNEVTRPYEGFLKIARFGLKDSPSGFSGSIVMPAEVKETREVQP